MSAQSTTMRADAVVAILNYKGPLRFAATNLEFSHLYVIVHVFYRCHFYYCHFYCIVIVICRVNHLDVIADLCLVASFQVTSKKGHQDQAT